MSSTQASTGPQRLTTTERTAATSDSRAERDRLLVAIHEFEAALASAAPGREVDWLSRVRRALLDLQNGLQDHAEVAEAPRGLLADIEANEPRLTSRVSKLWAEHKDLGRDVAALLRQMERHGDDAIDFADVRQRASRLLNSIRNHIARETDLIFEATSTDIGVGD